MKTKSIIKKINEQTIEVSGIQLSLDKDLIKTNQFKTAGTDYYIFCKKKSDKEYFISDKKKEKGYKLVGGFHYGLIPENFEARNNITKKDAKKIAGINAYSIWDKKHRPNCEPESMVYIPKLKIWIDIYLTNNEHKEFGTSKAGKNILAGNEHNGRKLAVGLDQLKGIDIDAIAELHKKRLLTKDEFQVAMDGVKENVSANDLDDGTIKHIPDLTSRYGIEQATGVQWIWSSTKYGKQDEDDDRFILGGYRTDGIDAGSRASHWNYSVWGSTWDIGSRFACDNLTPVKSS